MKPHLARLGVLMVLAMLALPGAARADSVTQDSVTQWSETAANALLRDAGQGAYGLPQMAMVHGAMFDAANSIDHRYRPYLAGLRARPWYSSDAAAPPPRTASWSTAAWCGLTSRQRWWRRSS